MAPWVIFYLTLLFKAGQAVGKFNTAIDDRL